MKLSCPNDCLRNHLHICERCYIESQYGDTCSCCYTQLYIHSTNRRRGTPFQLFITLKLHANNHQKAAIATSHAFGMSVSYDHVMDVRKDFAKVISKQWTGDCVVMPTNVKYCVFVSNAVNKLDESGQYNFHGTAKTVTSHLTYDKMRKGPPTLKLDFLKGVHFQILMIMLLYPTLMNMLLADVTSLGAELPVESWLQEPHQVMELSDWKKHVLYTLGFLSHNHQIET